MERENSFITRWNDKKDTTVSPARRTQVEIADGCCVCVFFVCVLICPHCIRASQIRDAIEQVSCFFLAQMKGLMGKAQEAGGRSRWVRREKGCVPVNLYARYFMPGCLSREKTFDSDNRGEKKSNRMPPLLLKSEISCPCQLHSAPHLVRVLSAHVCCSGAAGLYNGKLL